MGHYVEYLVNATQDEVFARLPCEARQEYSARPEADRNGLIECRGWRSGELIGVQLDPFVTQLSLPVKYSRLVHADPESLARVERFDQVLANVFCDRAIIRVDEVLLHEWEQRSGEAWRAEPSGMAAFYGWLVQQAPEHWHAIRLGGIAPMSAA